MVEPKLNDENVDMTVERQIAEPIIINNIDDKILAEEHNVIKKIKIKQTKKLRKHDVLGPCQCKKNCYQNIDQERMLAINNQIWKKTYQQQGNWLIQVVKSVEKQQERLRNENNERDYAMKKRRE